jgi:hypothetical protein
MTIHPAKVISVLVSGKAGVGKTTFSRLLAGKLVEYGLNSQIVSFAGPLKGLARAMGWDGVKDDKGRHLLQSLGATGRQYDENLWVNLAYNGDLISYCAEHGTVCITDDWRFPNEVVRLNENPFLDVFTFKIVAPEREILKGTPRYNDISETALDGNGYVYDMTLDNSGDISKLHITADSVVKYIISHCDKWE